MNEDHLSEDEKKELLQLRAEKEAKENRELTLKISQKGAVSLYGLGRFPVTLYKEQWEKVFPFVDKIKSFIAENESQLSTKG